MKQNIPSIEKGYGSLKYYSYQAQGIKLTTKESIRQAIELRLIITRRDKITSNIETFSYIKMDFIPLKSKEVSK